MDVGSNTVHVLVADVEPAGDRVRLTEVGRYVEMPEMGAEVARTGRIGEAKAEAVVAALVRVLAQARTLGFAHLAAGATAAVRRAADGQAFLERATAAIGLPLRLLAEEREAQLSFAGVASAHAGRGGWLMGDIGGGSTELVVAHGQEIRAWASLALGSGSLAAQHLSDPPRPGERERLRAAAVPEVGRAPDCSAERLVLTGGTATNLARLVSRPAPPPVLTTPTLLALSERLDAAPAAHLAALSEMAESRIRALRGGVEIMLLLLDFYGLDRFHVSSEGLRQGMLLAYDRRGEDWWRL